MTRPLSPSQRRRLAAAERKLAAAQARHANAPKGRKTLTRALMEIANRAAMWAAVGRRVDG